MTGHELSNPNNNNNKLQMIDGDGKKEIIKAKNQKTKQETKPVPVVKNYLVETTNGLIKVTGSTLVKVKNKLAKIDWGKLLLTFLTELIKANTNKYPSGNNQTYAYSYTYNQTTHTKKSVQTTNKQEQINTTKQQDKSIEAKKQKQIKGTKAKEIKTNKTTKQIPKQKDNKTINIKQSPLMIEKKEQNRD